MFLNKIDILLVQTTKNIKFKISLNIQTNNNNNNNNYYLSNLNLK